MPTSPKSAATIRRHLLNHIHGYHAHRYSITEIKCDEEPGVLSLREELNALGIKLTTGVRNSKNTATPAVDGKINIMKERIRITLHQLDYPLPSYLLKHLVFYITSRMNMIGSNPYTLLSPKEILTGCKLDYRRDLRLSFGAFVQVKVPRTENCLDEKTVSRIALNPAMDNFGSTYFYSLKTKDIIKRNVWTEVPITDAVVHYISNISKEHIQLTQLDKAIRSTGTNNPENENIVNELFDGQLQYLQSLRRDAFDNTTTETETTTPGETAQENQTPETTIEEVTQDILTPENVVTPETIPQRIQQQEIITENNPLFNQPSQPQDEEQTPTDEVPEQSPNIPHSNEDMTEPVHPPEEPATRRSNRPNKGNQYREILEMLTARNFNMTVKAALAKDPAAVIKAITTEFLQMEKLHVWDAIGSDEEIDPEADLIPSQCIMKEKQDPQGKHVKWKGRMVGGGNYQTKKSIGECSSPTMSLESLLTLCTILIEEEMQAITADVIGAYLEADMKEKVYMRIDKKLVPYLLKIDPKYANKVRANGDIIVKLKKALYGCRQSGRLWYEKISQILISIGFTKCPHDECVFMLERPGEKKIIVGLYVDDLWIMTHNDKDQQWIVDQLKSKVTGMTINHGKVQNYLGMEFDFTTKDELRITTKGYIKEILRTNGITQSVNTPATSGLFEVNDKLPLLNNFKQNVARSTVYKLLYLSKRTRPDIAAAVSFLCTRVDKYTIEDELKITRVLKYLHGTQELGLRFTKTGKIDVKIHADASYGAHTDGKGHSGLLITINDNPILFKSNKQKINTMSTSECELVCLSNSIAHICSITNLLDDLKIKINSQVIYQDNLSTIKMVQNERPTSQRTKHINIRYFTIRERTEQQNIRIEHLRTHLMVADILTKPLYGTTFRDLRSKLLNWNQRNGE